MALVMAPVQMLLKMALSVLEGAVPPVQLVPLERLSLLLALVLLAASAWGRAARATNEYRMQESGKRRNENLIFMAWVLC
jgi:hypothetical protein